MVSGNGFIHTKVKITDPKKFKIEGEVEFMAATTRLVYRPIV